MFKVPTHRKEIGDLLDIYSVNCEFSPNYPLLRKVGKKIRLLLQGQKGCELVLESSELVGGQIMRSSESKG